ncbi:MAG: prepilin-type N-terminal cleavage/methylation domain-containing protein [Planctomycetota bacterium]
MNRRGFTLLELLLVLTILAALGAMIVPNAINMLTARNLTDAADRVRVGMMESRLEAMRSGRTQIMRFRVGGRGYERRAWQTSTDTTEAIDKTGSTGALMLGATTPAVATEINLSETDAGVAEMLPEDVVFENAVVQPTARGSLTQQLGLGTDLQSDIALGDSYASPIGGGAIEESDDAGAWSAPVYFYPDGSTSTFALRIYGEKAKGRIVVMLRGLTGEPVIGKVTP